MLNGPSWTPPKDTTPSSFTKVGTNCSSSDIGGPHLESFLPTVVGTCVLTVHAHFLPKMFRN